MFAIEIAIDMLNIWEKRLSVGYTVSIIFLHLTMINIHYITHADKNVICMCLVSIIFFLSRIAIYHPFSYKILPDKYEYKSLLLHCAVVG